MVDNKILQEVKEYIRVDDYGDDSNNKTNEEIKMFIMSAETFLKSHGVKKDYNN